MTWQNDLDKLKERAVSAASHLTPERFRQNTAARRAFDAAVKAKKSYRETITDAASKIDDYTVDGRILGFHVVLSLHESDGMGSYPIGWRWHLSISGKTTKDKLVKILAHLAVPEGSKVGDLPLASHWDWTARTEEAPA